MTNLVPMIFLGGPWDGRMGAYDPDVGVSMVKVLKPAKQFWKADEPIVIHAPTMRTWDYIDSGTTDADGRRIFRLSTLKVLPRER